MDLLDLLGLKVENVLNIHYKRKVVKYRKKKRQKRDAYREIKIAAGAAGTAGTAGMQADQKGEAIPVPEQRDAGTQAGMHPAVPAGKRNAGSSGREAQFRQQNNRN